MRLRRLALRAMVCVITISFYACGATRQDKILSALDALNGATLVLQTTLTSAPPGVMSEEHLLLAHQALKVTYEYLIQAYRLTHRGAEQLAENLVSCAAVHLRATVKKVLPSGVTFFLLERAMEEVRELGVKACSHS